MNTQTPQHLKETGQEIFQDLANLKPGHWKIKSDWKALGFLSSDRAKCSGWVHVEHKTVKGQQETNLMWTNGKDTHHPHDSTAHSLIIDQQGRLMFHAKSILRMHMEWARHSISEHKVDDAKYMEALDFAKAIHKAIVIDQRATWEPETPVKTKVNVDAMTVGNAEDTAEKAAKPKGP